MTSIVCTRCIRSIDPKKEDYSHRGSCGHHLCMPCALPSIVGGKGYCTSCPNSAAPADPARQLLGNMVLGADLEQNKRAAAALRDGLKVSKLGPLEPYLPGDTGGALTNTFSFLTLTHFSSVFGGAASGGLSGLGGLHASLLRAAE